MESNVISGESHFSKTISSERFAIETICEEFCIDIENVIHKTLINGVSEYDFEIAGYRFDVKYANPSFINRGRTVPGWSFDLRNKGVDYCDFLVLLGLIEDKAKTVFLVSTKESPQRHLRVPIYSFSKWNKYIIKEFYNPIKVLPRKPVIIIPEHKIDWKIRDKISKMRSRINI